MSEEEQKQQLTDAFLSELRELMKRHGVTEIIADDHWTGYPECGQDIRITATIDSIWEGTDLKRPYIEINLGKGFYAEP